ncbi:MAG TPA: prepilin-type N-terminal cleavage/methylation domain-containing protein [Candidatus Saccharimonadales bacterium]|nr:prepilin-type N-terminal cleavage/methylation domain-containing protein [Candidatus Saccharimonadales bacterium]
MKLPKPSHSPGFTIVELLVATSVFSVVLLGALAGFLEIGHLFYKGVSTSNTQAVANQILQDVSGQFQTNGGFTSVPPTDGSTYAYYCIGDTRYTYNINHEVNVNDSTDRSPGGHYGILKDVLPGDGCGTPCVSSCVQGEAPFQSPTELLGDKMTLRQFSITPSASGSNFFNISIVVSYGEDDAFDNISDPNTIVCKANSGLDQFCSVSRLNTSAYKGFSL